MGEWEVGGHAGRGCSKGNGVEMGREGRRRLGLGTKVGCKPPESVAELGGGVAPEE